MKVFEKEKADNIDKIHKTYIITPNLYIYMKRRKEELSLSLVNQRDEEKRRKEAKRLNQKRGGEVKRHRGLIEAIILCFALGAGTGLVLTNVKVPMDGPDSPEIPLILKAKYGFSNFLDDLRGRINNKLEKKIETPEKEKNDSKIHIEINIPPDASCDENDKQGCLVS